MSRLTEASRQSLPAPALPPSVTAAGEAGWSLVAAETELLLIPALSPSAAAAAEAELLLISALPSAAEAGLVLLMTPLSEEGSRCSLQSNTLSSPEHPLVSIEGGDFIEGAREDILLYVLEETLCAAMLRGHFTFICFPKVKRSHVRGHDEGLRRTGQREEAEENC